MVENKTKFEISVWNSVEAKEGVGATVRRALGIRHKEDLDPFLMMDHFKVKLPGGFPDHPHRGFETVTYMFSGEILHEDFKGHKGNIGPGDVQWMTAGKGIVHSEMPGSWDEYSIGIQLWINLNRSNKMCEPLYQEFTNEKIPVVEIDDESYIKIISGNFNGKTGPVKSVTSVEYYDIYLKENQSFEINIGKGKKNCFIYVHSGESINILGKKIEKYQSSSIFSNNKQDEILTIKTEKYNSEKLTGFILLIGTLIEEPISKYGPFVMNTMDEIENTFRDYQLGRNGFEGAHEWESKIKDLSKKKK